MAQDLRAQAAVPAGDVSTVWAPQPGPQSAALTCPIADILFGGARGGGKTSWLLGDYLTHSAKWAPHARGILFRRSYDELDEVKDQAAEIYFKAKADWSSSKNTWYMPWGGWLKLRYLARDADASRYQGHAYNWAGVDEAGNFANPDPIDKIKATLRDKRGIPVRFPKTANPGGPGHAWLKERYVDVAQPYRPYLDPETGDPRIFIPSRLQDNRILLDADPGYVNRLRGSGPAWLIAAWLQGDWNATPEGGIIKGEWLQNRYLQIPVEADRCVHSWDTAYKPEQINDPSVCTSWRLGRGARGYFLADLYRKRMAYPDLKKKVIELANRDNPDAILIEDKASGQSLIQELRANTSLPIIAIEPKGDLLVPGAKHAQTFTSDKETRMFTASTAFESGLVVLPAHAFWMLDYEIELTTFPLAPHDDQVDSTSQFLNWIKGWSFSLVSHGTGPRTSVTAHNAEKQDDDNWGDVDLSRETSTEGFI